MYIQTSEMRDNFIRGLKERYACSLPTKSIKNKALDAAMVPLTEKIEKLNDEIKENRTESSKMLFRYESMVKEIVKNEARTVGGTQAEESNEDNEE